MKDDIKDFNKRIGEYAKVRAFHLSGCGIKGSIECELFHIMVVMGFDEFKELLTKLEANLELSKEKT